MRHSLQVLSLAFLLLFFLSCTQIVTAIAKPPTDPPPASPDLLWLHFVAVCFAWALGGKFQYGSNTQQAYQMQCRAAPGKPQQHSKCPSAHALQYTLFPFPCCSSFLFYSCMQRSQSVVDHLRLRILLGFSLDMPRKMLLLLLELPPSSSLSPYIKLY